MKFEHPGFTTQGVQSHDHTQAVTLKSMAANLQSLPYPATVQTAHAKSRLMSLKWLLDFYDDLVKVYWGSMVRDQKRARGPAKDRRRNTCAL